MSGGTCKVKRATVYDSSTTLKTTGTTIEAPSKVAQEAVKKTEKAKQEEPHVPVPSIDFHHELPFRITNEIKIIKKQTERDNKEKSLTLCQVGDRLFVGNYAKGDAGSTEVMPCHKKFGKNAIKIGDVHTHPFNDMGTIGATPSEADFVSNLTDSFQLGIPQISCVVGAGKKSIYKYSNAVHCFQPKPDILNDQNKLKQYNRALMSSPNVGNDIHPYLRENIGKDFMHIWYRGNKAITPEEEQDYKVQKELFSEMVGQSENRLRVKDLHEMDKGTFCDLIQDYNLPGNDGIGKICRYQLESRNILGMNI